MDVPAGVSSENYITMRGQGHAGPRGGPAGDLLVMLDVEEDPRFLRHDDDLVYDLQLTFSQAVLGTEAVVPTPYGEERIKIPSGTQPGTVLRLKGRGLPHLGSELAGLEGEPPAARGGRSFWDRMKEALGA